MTDNFPFISIIIPCRNEEKFIGKCLDSIVTNDYPKDRMEILIVDGVSKDSTRNIVQKYILQYPFIKLLDNPKKITPCAFNIGINESKGQFISIMGAHAEYPRQFISKGIETLNSTKADVVGGPVVTMPSSDTLIAKGITLITSHPFGVGNSKFRTTMKECYVDTVPFGVYRRDVFNKFGLFDERLVRNQDNELSSRIVNNGGKIFFTPVLLATYFNQSNIRGLIKQALKTGMWNVLTIIINHTAFRWRHFIPFLFVTSLLMCAIFAPFYLWEKIAFVSLIGLYGSTALLSSFQICLREGVKYFLLLPILFFLYHLCYGLGTWGGLLKIIISTFAERRNFSKINHSH